MTRSVWKGPFVEESLIKKAEKQKNESGKKPIKTWSRKSTIIPDFVGVSFLIYNGKKFIPMPKKRRSAKNGRFIEISGATGNNLKKVNLKLPVGAWVMRLLVEVCVLVSHRLVFPT